MKTKNTTKLQTEKLVLMALLTALVAVLAYLGGFIKIGGLASISLTLIPVVLGGALLGPLTGAWLGGVAGAVFFAAYSVFYVAAFNIYQLVYIMRMRFIDPAFLQITQNVIAKHKAIAVTAKDFICHKFALRFHCTTKKHFLQ